MQLNETSNIILLLYVTRRYEIVSLIYFYGCQLCFLVLFIIGKKLVYLYFHYSRFIFYKRTVKDTKLKNRKLTKRYNFKTFKIDYKLASSSKDVNKNFRMPNHWNILFILLLIIFICCIVFDSAPTATGDIKRITQNSQVNLHEHNLLLFTSKGQGQIQFENCLGYLTQITLSKTPNYNEIIANHIQITKTQNNLFTFNHAGEVYIHSKTKGFVLIRWRNIDYGRGTGYAYRYIKPSSFKINYDPTSKQYSVSVQPLRILLRNYEEKFQIFEVRFRVVLARNLRNLRDGLYCRKGIFMQGGLTIKDSQKIYAGERFDITINSADALLKSFNYPQMLLVGVKAQIKLLWLESNVVEDYRFYYKNQQLVFSRYMDAQNKRKQIKYNRRSLENLDI